MDESNLRESLAKFRPWSNEPLDDEIDDGNSNLDPNSTNVIKCNKTTVEEQVKSMQPWINEDFFDK